MHVQKLLVNLEKLVSSQDFGHLDWLGKGVDLALELFGPGALNLAFSAFWSVGLLKVLLETALYPQTSPVKSD